MPIKAMAKINKVKKNIGQNITQTFSAKIAFSCISNWSVTFILYICMVINNKFIKLTIEKAKTIQ